ncbi:MAG: putative zinc-binding protein [bacterium]|nr:putative zinc-binding protein [bacterium]
MAKTLTIEEPGFSCSLAKEYVKKHVATPPKMPVVACEGSCLRGEIARRAANFITYKLSPETTVRICFQGIVSGGCEEGVLIEMADKVLFVEGCALKCSSRLVQGAMEIKAKTDVVVADQLCDFNPKLFGIDEMPDEEISILAEGVAEKIAGNIKEA